jgi:uncharacterized membrane protein YczE
MLKRIGDVFLVILGSIMMGIGITLAVKSNLGLDSFSLFNSGLGKQLGISIGSASQLVVITILVVLFIVDRKRVGLGSVINGILVGGSVDLFVPLINQFDGNNKFFHFFVLLSGLLCIGIGIGTYIAAHLGEAGVDALMILLAEKLGRNIKVIRIIIDILLAGIGFLLGGQVGLGTLIAMFVNGPVIQATISIIDKLKIKLDCLALVNRVR